MQVGDKFTREIYTGQSAEVTVTSVEETCYRYLIAFPDGRQGAGFRRWTDSDAQTKEDTHG